jgi:hypothetical protein
MKLWNVRSVFVRVLLASLVVSGLVATASDAEARCGRLFHRHRGRAAGSCGGGCAGVASAAPVQVGAPRPGCSSGACRLTASGVIVNEADGVILADSVPVYVGPTVPFSELAIVYSRSDNDGFRHIGWQRGQQFLPIQP